MEKTLEKKSRIIKLKSKFFLTRAVSYASFLLIPVWLPKLLELSNFMKIAVIMTYIFFIGSQMFLLGKEVDHRFKIYFKFSSSAETLIYRILMGMLILMIYFGILSYLPMTILKNFYWGTWIFLGLFYSWPTRGKIIEDTMSGHLVEFRFLDAFEKTTLFLILFLFLISIPKVHYLENIESLKLYFDPMESFSSIFWNFLSVNYFPFYKFPQLFKLSYWLHFYVLGMGLFCLAFYCLARHFVSRRLALLGVFSLVSSWSFSKFLGQNLNVAITNTFSVIWVWSFFWGYKSSTYRSGLLIGLIGFLGTVINKNFFFLLLFQQFAYYFFVLREKNSWYRKQLMKYSLFGTLLSLLVIFAHIEDFLFIHPIGITTLLHEIQSIIQRKAFFSLAIIGPILFLFMLFIRQKSVGEKIFDPLRKFEQFFMMVFFLLIFSLLIDSAGMKNFSLMWIISFFSLMPLEWIFLAIRRLRSKRNMIYLIYILICLLDSHIEGRIKILMDLFQNG